MFCQYNGVWSWVASEIVLCSKSWVRPGFMMWKGYYLSYFNLSCAKDNVQTRETAFGCTQPQQVQYYDIWYNFTLFDVRIYILWQARITPTVGLGLCCKQSEFISSCNGSHKLKTSTMEANHWQRLIQIFQYSKRRFHVLPLENASKLLQFSKTETEKKF